MKLKTTHIKQISKPRFLYYIWKKVQKRWIGTYKNFCNLKFVLFYIEPAKTRETFVCVALKTFQR
ncbi:unnamed protein product [Timema podura]|uniref:Uncharacterized protein n=1 Tax=Timema podura TaxID=61482 RepID=A0ABN7NLY3_TIMPD|nr:unnamed protein product [Timema podura]